MAALDTSPDVDPGHAALLAIAKPMRVRVYLNWKERRDRRPHIELFARDVMLRAFWDFEDAAAWLQAGRQGVPR